MHNHTGNCGNHVIAATIGAIAVVPVGYMIVKVLSEIIRFVLHVCVHLDKQSQAPGWYLLFSKPKVLFS